ncbi:hypothetical protein A4D02_14140 [Niastella koreensis]|uniref:Uncharacterized protein n=1 Tax=Niastella koreensis TaxID=354356 RepID=A0ABX3NNY6_9BACT|nr:hypothetical protein [Niastella koreensis]OQP41815.1 hypothetical protein A4D02_14140 [Niastella koreensis]
MLLYKAGFRLFLLMVSIFMISQQCIYGNKVHVAGDPVNNRIIVDTLPGNCSKNEEIEKIINDAISLGAPIYNEGLHIACYRIYEWAGYKILYEYGKTCKEVEKILKSAIEKSHGDYSDIEKAWLMRAAFDKILGVPTRMGESEKGTVPRRG